MKERRIMKFQSNNGGFWVLFGLVVMLTVPMVIGHYTLASQTAARLHADASAAE